jgi:hypothetical protein
MKELLIFIYKKFTSGTIEVYFYFESESVCVCGVEFSIGGQNSPSEDCFELTMSVFINSLDDFIAPSQACVNPFVQEKLEQSKGSAKITLQSDFSISEYDTSVKPDLIKTKAESTTRVATVSLNDCLACRWIGIYMCPFV